MTTCAVFLGALFCVPPILSDQINVQINTVVKCLDRNTFTAQGKIGNFDVTLDAVLYCPDGYMCQEGTDHPCIVDLDPPTTIASTEPTSPTPPPGPPACYSHGFWPGPTCQEYYECVSKWWWWEPQLRKCEDGSHFSDAEKQCVPEAQSNCTDQ